MKKYRVNHRRAALAAVFLLVVAACGAAAATETESAPRAIELAQAGGTQPRDLEPRYQPAPPEEKSWYNSSYIFAVTRSVADSTLVPAAKVPLYLLTVPVDLVLLPFATIGGFFG
jgi:hypothetical protein